MLAKVSSSGVSFFFSFIFSRYFGIFNCYFRTGDDGNSKWEIPKQEDGWDGRRDGREGKRIREGA